MLQGLYTSVSPNLYPSYQDFTSGKLYSILKSINIFSTSFSVNPKKSEYCLSNIEYTLKLFKSENIPALITLIIPVIIPIFK